jgi:hypothetical protein
MSAVSYGPVLPEDDIQRLDFSQGLSREVCFMKGSDLTRRDN